MKEADLSGHLENNGKKKKKKGKSNTEETPEKQNLQVTDSQLYEAITLLKGLNLFIEHQNKMAKKLAESQQQATESPADSTEK